MAIDAAVGFTLPRGVPRRRAIEFADERAFDFVELVMHGPLDPAGLRAGNAGALAGTDLDVTIHLPMQVDVGSPFDGVREGSLADVEDCLDAAVALPAPVRAAVLHPTSLAGTGRDWSVDVRERIVAAVDGLADYAAGLGVDLCVENLYRSEFALDGFEPLLETDASVCLDTGHARVDGFDEAAVAAFLEEHGDRVRHVHLNDVRGRGSVRDEHLPFGAGDTDFRTMFAPLADGWSGTMDLEVTTPNLRYIEHSRSELERVLGDL